MLVLALNLALSLNCPAQKHCDEMQDVSLLNPVAVCIEAFCVWECKIVLWKLLLEYQLLNYCAGHWILLSNDQSWTCRTQDFSSKDLPRPAGK